MRRAWKLDGSRTLRCFLRGVFLAQQRADSLRHMDESGDGTMPQIIAELACCVANAAREAGLAEARLVGLDTNVELTRADIYAIYDGAQLLLEP